MKTRFLKSFTFRIFSVTSLVLLISLAALTLVNSYSLSRRETEQQIYSGTNTLNQAASFIEYRVHAIEGIMNVISYDDTIQTVLSTVRNTTAKILPTGTFIPRTVGKSCTIPIPPTTSMKSAFIPPPGRLPLRKQTNLSVSPPPPERSGMSV